MRNFAIIPPAPQPFRPRPFRPSPMANGAASWHHSHFAADEARSSLTVIFSNGESVHGQTMTERNTERAPILTWNASADELYTIIMYDTDAPEAKKNGKEWVHWLVTNIPGNDVASGHVVQEYFGPKPASNSGFHRYIIRVYKQYGTMSVPVTGREEFDESDFVIDNNLHFIEENHFFVESAKAST